MAALHAAAGRPAVYHGLAIRRVSLRDTTDALREGMADFMRKPSHYAFLVVVYPVIGLALFTWAARGNALHLVYPLVGGFALLGPFAALGLYEISRRLEEGRDASWTHALEVLRSPAFPAILRLGAFLLGVFALWLMSAQAIFGLTLGNREFESLGALARAVVGSPQGWALIVVGNGVGILFAFLVLCTTVVAFPLLLDRNVSATAAMRASADAVAANPGPMVAWGLMVAGLLFAGALPGLIGLIVVLPVLGHATWHLYRNVIA